ncbi:unnamed protein product [Auanema sp. JU1783]|nr:unnamed protein product [Auanema sp. JU1783]
MKSSNLLLNSTRLFVTKYFPHRLSSSTATSSQTRKSRLKDGPGLKDFIIADQERKRLKKVSPSVEETETYLKPEDYNGGGRKVKFVTYGCQMNVNDMEIVRSLLFQNDYQETNDEQSADVVLLMTCSIREGAEEKVWRELKKIKRNASRSQVVGVLGCMAENVKHSLFKRKGLIDVVAGPDSYKDLARLLAVARSGTNAINVQLSLEETYADVAPVRVDQNTRTAFVSIMRGCDNMCSFCVVPFTRGRERSRPIDSILEEVRRLSDEGYKQITLLGQNVNSYRDNSESIHSMLSSSGRVPGFNTVYKPKQGGRSFAMLLEKVSEIDPEMRIRFTSPHPKDFPLEVIELIRERPNICNQLHMPAQSGDNETLEQMGRGYTREAYLKLVEDVRSLLPDVFITSDFIAGFCGETEEAHKRTLDLMKAVEYSFCYVFPYSLRGKTRAHHRLTDDVHPDVKKRRHQELASVFRETSLKFHSRLVGTNQLVLVEGESKRSDKFMQGRCDGGTKVIFNRTDNINVGDYVSVQIENCSSQTMSGSFLGRTTLTEFSKA